LHCDNLCFYCGHGNIWHSKKQKPPTDEFLAFNSTRKPARTPIYEKKNICIGILMPMHLELPESNVVYCDAIEMLPV